MCALWNEAAAFQKRGMQPTIVGNSDCCGEVDGSKLAPKIRNL